MPRDSVSHPKLTAAEQALRAQLEQYIRFAGLMRATLTTRERVCGKDNCKCNSGDKHKSLYLVSRQNGETRQLFIPKHLERKARQWVNNYIEIQDLIEKISERSWSRLEERED